MRDVQRQFPSGMKKFVSMSGEAETFVTLRHLAHDPRTLSSNVRRPSGGAMLTRFGALGHGLSHLGGFAVSVFVP